MSVALDIASLATQSPITSVLGVLSKKKKRKAKKKAKRQAKKAKAAAAESLVSQGVSPAAARQMANQQAAASASVAAPAAVGSSNNPLMRDYLNIGVPTIPLAAAAYFVLPKVMQMLKPKAKRVYRRTRSRVRRYRRRR